MKVLRGFLPMAGLKDIKECIDAGFPVLVYVPAHVFAIFGYDEALDTFVTYDIATNDVWVEYLQKDFIKAWKGIFVSGKVLFVEIVRLLSI